LLEVPEEGLSWLEQAALGRNPFLFSRPFSAPIFLPGLLLLEVSSVLDMLSLCRFMNFIAGSAKKTAKYWCAQASGKAPSVRIAGPRSFPSGSPFLPHPPEPVTRRRRLAELKGAVAVAAVTVPAASINTENTEGGVA